MFPGTHLVIDRKKGEQDRNRVTHKEKKVLHLKRGQLIIFCLNVAHCGGRSSGNPVSGGFQSDIDIVWFTGKNKGAKITDISIHVGLQNKLFHKSIQSDYDSSVIKLIKAIFVETTHDAAKKD